MEAQPFSLWRNPYRKPRPAGPDLYPRSYATQVRFPLGQRYEFTLVVCAEGHQEVVCNRMSKENQTHCPRCHPRASAFSVLPSICPVECSRNRLFHGFHRSPAHITGNTIARVSHACLSVSVVWCSQVVTLSFPGAITAIPWDSHTNPIVPVGTIDRTCRYDRSYLQVRSGSYL